MSPLGLHSNLEFHIQQHMHEEYVCIGVTMALDACMRMYRPAINVVMKHYRHSPQGGICQHNHITAMQCNMKCYHTTRNSQRKESQM